MLVIYYLVLCRMNNIHECLVLCRWNTDKYINIYMRLLTSCNNSMKWNVFIEHQQTVHLRQKARRHLKLLQVDLEAGQWMPVKGWLLNKKVKLKLNFNFLTLLVKGWLLNKKGGMTVTKKMRRAIWQLTGNWGTLQS